MSLQSATFLPYQSLFHHRYPVLEYSQHFLSLFILGPSPCPDSMLIVGWWISNPRTEAIGIPYSVPLMCLKHYVISHIISSRPSSSTATPLILSSPLPCPLPLPLPPPAPSHPLVLPPPVPTISEPTTTPAYAPYSCRGP